MLQKVLKGFAFALGGLVGVALLAALGLYLTTNYRMNKTYDPPVSMVALPSDVSSVESGRHFFVVHCAGCHGTDLAGSVVFSDPQLGTIAAPKLARGIRRRWEYLER